MSCERWQEEIEEQVGPGSISAELSAHLDSCRDCRQYFEEVKRALDILSAESLIVDGAEADLFLAGVNKRIDLHALSRRSNQIWPRFLAAAAVVLIAIGSLVTVNKYSSNDNTVSSSGFSEQDLIATIWDEVDFDDASIDLLLSEISPANRQEVEEVFLEGLSDDDMVYLERNFRVGDLL